MPYRIDIPDARDAIVDRVIALGAIDLERTPTGLAAIVPDAVDRDARQLARVLGVASVRITPATGRDDDSVWVLAPRAVSVAGLTIVPARGHADSRASADAARETDRTLQLVDAPAFGTGLHPTSALCLEAIRDAMALDPELDRAREPAPGPDVRSAAGTGARRATLLDIGTGSGLLALGALRFGLARVAGIDVDAGAVATAAENARLNGLGARCGLAVAAPAAIGGSWPLVVANILPAPLVELAPSIAPRVARGGRLVLSGIPESLASEVAGAYVRLGLRQIGEDARGGWAVVILRPTW
ncbi:MAG: 50S ribosomal protein L11 methyltransferase [Vicinamibacterales bacterium]